MVLSCVVSEIFNVEKYRDLDIPVKGQSRSLITGSTKKFNDIFSRLDRMHKRERQTDRQTDIHRAIAKTAHIHSVAR